MGGKDHKRGCVRVSVCVCMYVCVCFVCMHVCLRVSMRVCMRVCALYCPTENSSLTSGFCSPVSAPHENGPFTPGSLLHMHAAQFLLMLCLSL